MTDQEWNERAKWLMGSLPEDWDSKPLTLAHEIRNFLQSIKDEGTDIDSGTDGTTGDLWVTVEGIEYFLAIRKSNNQLKKEGKPIPT